jgi:orotate phosphoribosyltransferase
MNKEQLFDEICKVKDFMITSPQIGLIGFVPIRPNFQRLMSEPKVFHLIIEIMAEAIKKMDFDLIAGGESSGIPMAAGLSLVLNKPFVYVRKAKVKGMLGDVIEGSYRKGQKAIFIDDLVSKSETLRMLVSNLKDSGLGTNDIFTIMICKGPWFEEDQQWIKEEGIKIHYLFSWQELAEAQKKRGAIPEEIYPYYINYIEHPEEWQKNKDKWQEYCQVLKHKLNIPIPEFLEDMLKMK